MKSSLSFFRSFLIVMALAFTTASAQDWPQWRGPDRDGKVTGFSVPDAWPQQLKPVWKTDVGFADATPALLNNRLYVFTRQGENEILLCLDAETGKQIWKSDGYPAVTATGPAASHPGPRSSPAVTEGKIATVGLGGDIACFDAETGKLLWRNEEFKGTVPQFYTGMSPLIASGVCLAHLGGPETGFFVAFDLASGKLRWKTAGDGPAYGSPALMTADGIKQVVFPSRTKLSGIDLASGKILWEYGTPAGTGRVQNAASPVIDGQKIYFTGLNNGVNAIEIKRQGDVFAASPLWTNADLSTSYNTPVLKDGFLYGISNKSRLFCINASSGQTAWIDDKPHQTFGSIVDAGSVMIAVSSIADLVVFRPDSKSYSEIAVMKVSDNSVYAHPVLSGNKIFIKDSEWLTLFTASVTQTSP